MAVEHTASRKPGAVQPGKQANSPLFDFPNPTKAGEQAIGRPEYARYL